MDSTLPHLKELTGIVIGRLMDARLLRTEVRSRGLDEGRANGLKGFQELIAVFFHSKTIQQAM